MTSLQPLPLDIFHMILGNLPGDRNGDLLNVACTCKALESLALDILYGDIVIDFRCKGLLPLAYRLLKAPDLAERARSLTLEAFPPKFEPIINWDVPTDFSQLSYRWLTDRSYSIEWVQSWRAALDRREADFLFAMIAQLCRNVSSMKFSCELSSCSFSGCPIFPEHDWVWKSLKNLHVENGNAVLEQLIRSPLNSTVSLNHLRYDGTNINEMLLAKGEPVKLPQIRSMVLETARDWPYQDLQWHAVTSMVEGCRALEYFSLQIMILRADKAINNVSKLTRSLAQHRQSLLTIDLLYKKMDSLRSVSEGVKDQIQPLHQFQYTGLVADFSAFDNLQHLNIEMFLLFGIIPFEAVKLALETTDEIPTTLRDGLRYSLIERLPSSLRVLGLAGTGGWERRQVLTHAIPGLLEHRVDRYPSLQSIRFLTSSDAYFQDLLSTPEVVAAKVSGFKFQFSVQT